MTSFPSKAAQKDALDRLNRAYSNLRMDHIHNFDVPFDLCHWRADKHAKLVTSEQAKQIAEWFTQREAIKAIPVIKPQTKQQERAERLNLRFGENNTLRTELLKQAPRLTAEFDAGWRAYIAKLVARGDHQLDYTSGRGIASYAERERIEDRYQNWQNIVSGHEFATRAGEIRSDKLAKAAKEYGERTALGWYEKMATKLGTATAVTVTKNSIHADIEIHGTISGHEVHVVQQIVFKVSSKGTPFHQFPALIYVDDKFTTEAEFATQFHVKAERA